MEDVNGQPLSLGSGFFVGEGKVASNLHVVEGAKRGYVKIIGQRTKYAIKGIIAMDSERDLVILKISGTHTGSVRFGDSESVQVGETVYAVGTPQGLEGTFSQGIVSSLRTVGANKLLQITAPISPGSSGGPVLNVNGEIIGVSVATFKSGQNLNFAIPSNYLKNLLGMAGSVKPLAHIKPAKSQSSTLADAGTRSSDGVVGDHPAWTYILGGSYSFSLQNKLRYDVKNVHCLIIFYSRDNIDFEIMN